MLGSDLRCSSSGEVGQGREEFFAWPIEFSRCFHEDTANQLHWESRKLGCVSHNCGSIVPQLSTTRADKQPRANVDFHKAPLQFASSNARFARPMAPTSRADELHTDGPSADASVVKRQNNISTNRARTGRRDPRRTSQARARLNNPMLTKDGWTKCAM